MKISAVMVALGAALLTAVNPGTAVAQSPLDPDRIPPAVWYAEAPTGEHRQGLGDPEPGIVPMPRPPSGVLSPGRIVLQTADRVETLPGARLVLKYADTLRPDGTRGPAWYWFNTRAGSTFHLDICDRNGVAQIRRVSRKRFQERVQSTREREIRVTYDRRANSGRFEVVTSWRARGPEPVPCPAAAALQAPEGVDLRLAGTGVHEESYDDRGSQVTVHDGDRLVVSHQDEGEIWRVFETGPGSTFVLADCLGSGLPARRVTKRQFLERAASTHERGIAFVYDAERGAGQFALSTYIEYFDCPPCYECTW